MTCMYFQVFPKPGESHPSTALSSTSHIKACIRCIESVKCLDVARGHAGSRTGEVYKSCGQRYSVTVNQPCATVQHGSECSPDDSVASLDEDGSEDSGLEGTPSIVMLQLSQNRSSTQHG